MNRLLCSLLVGSSLVACDGGKGSLGDLPASGDTTSAASTDDDQTASHSTGDMETGQPPAGGVGAPCTPSFIPVARLLEWDNPECSSNMCLYAEDVHPGYMQACTESSRCPGFGDGEICNTVTGVCELDPAHVLARSMCTDFCETNADCVGVDGTACEFGFECLPVTAFGPVCCQRMCACRDNLGPDDLASKCAAGTQEGCCDQEPPGEGCGG
jgi:hypothetical protein